MYPNSTEVSHLSLEARKVNKWALGGIFKTFETGVAIYQIAKSCESWYRDGSAQTDESTKWGCAYGAISTLISIAGAAYGGALVGATIGAALRQGLNFTHKRDEVAMHEHRALVTEYQRNMVNYTGMPLTPMFNEEGGLMFHNKSGMPLMFGYNPKGDGMLFTHMHYAETNKSYMAYGMVARPSKVGKRDVYFNEEDFTSGGLEAGFSYNQQSDGGYLDVHNDIGQMDHQVACTFAGLGNNALEFQIFDNDHQGTIAAGNIRAYSKDPYDRDSLTQDPTGLPLPEHRGCGIS